MEWVKISDKLPEIGKIVLLCDVVANATHDVFYAVGMLSPNGNWYVTSRLDFVDQDLFTHWIPITPPTEQQDDQQPDQTSK